MANLPKVIEPITGNTKRNPGLFSKLVLLPCLLSKKSMATLFSHLHFSLNELHWYSLHRDPASRCVGESLQKLYLYEMSYRTSSSILPHSYVEALLRNPTQGLRPRGFQMKLHSMEVSFL